jgi:hypothetical protein
MAGNDPTSAVKLSDAELCGALRQQLDAALSLVEAFASRLEVTDNHEAKAVIGHILNQGKEHADLLLLLIRRLHPEHREPLDHAPQKYCEIVIAGVQSAVEDVIPMQLSVGSLFPR